MGSKHGRGNDIQWHTHPSTLTQPKETKKLVSEANSVNIFKNRLEKLRENQYIKCNQEAD